MTLNVKRQILVTLGIVFGLLNINAQESGDFEIGANLGLSLAGVSAPEDNTTGTIATFNVGASGEYYFSNRWGIKVKFISDNKGYSNGTITDNYYNSLTTDIELHYITIPVMANWHFSKHRRWYLGFGSYLGLLTSAKDSELNTDIKNQMNGADYGITLCSINGGLSTFRKVRFPHQPSNGLKGDSPAIRH
jgi:hypothetical protein